MNGYLVFPTLKSKLWPITVISWPKKLSLMAFGFEYPCHYYGHYMQIEFMWWAVLIGSGDLP